MTDKKQFPILILGAGMAGLAAGAILQKRSQKSLILEKEDQPGGLCRNKALMGCDFDFGPKILILDKSPNSREILSYLNNNYEKYPVVERTYLHKYGLLGFPLQRHLVDLPMYIRKKILADIKLAHKKKGQFNSFREWLEGNFGKYFCKLVLFPYEQKKWQMPLNKMDYHWVTQRPLKVNYKDILEGSNKKLRPSRHYYYPIKGNISTLTKAIAKKAGPIRLGSDVTKINTKEKYVIAGGKKYYYNYLISSLPMDYTAQITKELPKNLQLASRKILKRLNILVINLVFKGNFKLDGTAIYFPERKFIFRRVSVLENLCPALARNEMTPISVEISVSPKNKNSNQSLLLRTLADFSLIPQFAQLGKPIAYSFLPIDFAYPLQLNGLTKHLEKLHRWYARHNIYFCGRGGNFDYCNSDIAYKQGSYLANKLAGRIKQ